MIAIDLNKDAVDVQKLLVDAVQKYSAKHNSTSTTKKHPPVTRIDIAYSFGDSESTPWVHLYFDTKPGGEPDGDPTHPDFAKLKRPNRLPAVQAVCDDEKVNVTQYNGKVKKCGWEELTKTIGKFLVDLLLEARKNKVFAALPKADHCELGVEDPTTGEFGWPDYEDRGKQNLAT